MCMRKKVSGSLLMFVLPREKLTLATNSRRENNEGKDREDRIDRSNRIFYYQVAKILCIIYYTKSSRIRKN